MTEDEPAELRVHDVFVVKAQRDEPGHGWECATCGAGGRAATRVGAIRAAYEHKRTATDRVLLPTG